MAWKETDGNFTVNMPWKFCDLLIILKNGGNSIIFERINGKFGKIKKPESSLKEEKCYNLQGMEWSENIGTNGMSLHKNHNEFQ